MNRRFMHNPQREKQVISAVIWLVIGFALLAFVMSACSPYVTTPEPTATATPSLTATAQAIAATLTPPPPHCTVTADALNFREGPGMSYAVKWILSKGDTLEVIARGAWLKVSTGNATGFIYGKYCQ
jgi:hypothetical protein